MTSLAKGSRKFSPIGDTLIPVVVLSKGCALKASDNDATRKKISQLADLIDSGTILALSKELMEVFDQEAEDYDNTIAGYIKNLIAKAGKRGQILKRSEIPIFVDGNVDKTLFSTVDLALITKNEAADNEMWKSILADDGFDVGNHRVIVQRVDLEIEKVGKFGQNIEISAGTPLGEIANYLNAPFLWSSRIIIWDQYILKNHLALQLNQEITEKNLWTFSGLERFLNMLVNILEKRKPLQSLKIVSKSKITDSNGQKYSVEQMVGALNSLVKKLNLQKYVEEFFLVWSDQDGSERWLGFEYDSQAYVYEFGKKGVGIVLKSEGKKFQNNIQKGFSIKGPLPPSEWKENKDYLRKVHRKKDPNKTLKIF